MYDEIYIERSTILRKLHDIASKIQTFSSKPMHILEALLDNFDALIFCCKVFIFLWSMWLKKIF